MDFINSAFPNEASLIAVEPFVRKVQAQIAVADAEIPPGVLKGFTGRKLFGELAGDIQVLSGNMERFKNEAEVLERLVQCSLRDITRLDNAKRNITASIDALNKMNMLALVVSDLQSSASRRQYEQAAPQLEVANQLFKHFQAYNNPFLKELRQAFRKARETLRSHVLNDFANLLEEHTLVDACQVVDSLDEDGCTREKLVATLCQEVVESYRQVLSKTNVVEQWYLWMRHEVQAEVWQRFPPHWKLPFLLCVKLCQATRGRLREDLPAHALEPAVFIKSLKKTLKLESELETLFSGSSFAGFISSCFEPHLTGVCIKEKERNLSQDLNRFLQEETWEGSVPLSSSTRLFHTIKTDMKFVSRLTRGDTLLCLFKVFQKVLRTYAARLSERVVLAPENWERDVRLVCYIVSTAEYCRDTASEMGECMSELLDPGIAASIDVSMEAEVFTGVMVKAIGKLVTVVKTCLEKQLAAMTRQPWATLQWVGDQSHYVDCVCTILCKSSRMVSSLISPVLFEHFVDKLVSSFAQCLYESIYKCKRMSEAGAQQMLLDTQAIKGVLLSLSSGRKFQDLVVRKIGRAEAMLKVILSPNGLALQTFRTLLPEDMPQDLERLLQMKTMK